MSRRNDFGFWQGAALFAVGGAAVLSSELMGVRREQEDVAVFTTLLFALLLLIYRSRWRDSTFWRDLTMIFAFHLIVVTVTLKSIHIGPSGLPGLALTAVTIVEGSLIIILLDKRSGGR